MSDKNPHSDTLDGYKLYCAELEKKVEKLREALKEAIDLVTSEYCSHEEPHSKDLDRCYAQQLLAVLSDGSEK